MKADNSGINVLLTILFYFLGFILRKAKEFVDS